MENEVKRPIRVLHVHGDLIAGGGQTLSREWLACFDRKFFDPSVVVLAEPTTLLDSFEKNAIPVTCIFGPRPMQIINLARYIRINKIDVVHTQSEPDRKVGHWAAFLTRRPVVAHLHSKWVYFVPLPKQGVVSKLKGTLALGLRKISERAVSHFVATSNEVKDAFIPHTKKPITTIEPGVATHTIDPKIKEELRKKLGVAENTTLIVNTSRLDELKNLEDFIDVVDQLKGQIDVVGYIFGEGQRSEKLLEMISKLKLQEHVKIFPPLSDLDEIYAAADIYLAPSLSESFGMSVLEAMAAGLPVVAYDLEGYRHFEGSFAKVQINDVEGLAKTCGQIVENQAHRVALIASAFKTAEQYDIEIGAEKLSEIDRKYAKQK